MADIRVGTSGFHYKHWIGRYYPAGMQGANMLEHYARDFDSVELNNTFYQLPEEKSFDAWRRGTPPGFTFAVKGSRFITHMIKLKDAQRGLTNFLPRAERLGEKLGPILWQLPPGGKSTSSGSRSFCRSFRANIATPSSCAIRPG